MAAHRYEEACAKFDASLRLSPGIGITMWLGECHEKANQLASAWTYFRSAASLAERARDDRARLATERAAALEPRLARLKIVRGAFRGNVLRDGVPIPDEALDVALPVDGGAHTIAFVRPDGSKDERAIEVPNAATTVTVQAPSSDLSSTTSAPLAPSSRGISTPKIVGVSLVAASAVLVGVGSVFGANAWSQRNDSNDGHCDANVCDAKGLALRDDAISNARTSTILFVVGGVALTAGVLTLVGLFDENPKKNSTARLPTTLATPLQFSF